MRLQVRKAVRTLQLGGSGNRPGKRLRRDVARTEEVLDLPLRLNEPRADGARLRLVLVHELPDGGTLRVGQLEPVGELERVERPRMAVQLRRSREAQAAAGEILLHLVFRQSLDAARLLSGIRLRGVPGWRWACVMVTLLRRRRKGGKRKRKREQGRKNRALHGITFTFFRSCRPRNGRG